jgi:hypothetical protein
MNRNLTLSDKEFIDNQRKLGKSCEWISSHLNIKIRHVYKWTAILRKESKPNHVRGRPIKGSGSSFDSTIIDRIKTHASIKEGWGSRSILAEMIQFDFYSPDSLPSSRTVERYLKELQLCKKYEKNRPLDKEPFIKAEKVHSCWQMDDKGVEEYSGVGHVSMINIKDTISGVHVQSFPI